MYQQDYQQATCCNNTTWCVSAGTTINRLYVVIALHNVYQDQQHARSKDHYFALSTAVTISTMHGFRNPATQIFESTHR
jgi:hypothetical protein